MDEPKKLFVAATKQDQGKTTVSLGLLGAFREMCPPVGFMKPVGQRYVEVDGVRVDEDVALMQAVFGFDCALGDMSPVTVGRTFTRDYILDPKPEVLMTRIEEGFERLSAGKRAVVIEGTGHAGVGSVFDTSNADVACRLGAKALLVTTGGIGKPIDEVMLNLSLFRDRGVDLVGVVLNKVIPSKIETVTKFAKAGLGRMGIDLLGVIPHEDVLANPTMSKIREELGGELINGKDELGNEIKTIVVGAMTAHRALAYIQPHCLLITPGDRDDLILAAMSSSVVNDEEGNGLAGIVLTGGIRPQENILRLIKRTRIPVLILDGDSYSVASAVNQLKVKIQPMDGRKIDAARRLVKEYVDVPRIIELMGR
ncbi:AAA family ATPase [bacterium]|nr:AAA family ATPase [bacterium]